MTTDRNQQIRASTLLYGLAEKAYLMPFLRGYMSGSLAAGKPGEMLAKLPTEQQELLKHLKSDDLRFARINHGRN